MFNLLLLSLILGLSAYTANKQAGVSIDNSFMDKVQKGELTADEAMKQIAAQGGFTSPEVEKWFNNALANQRTEEARAYETNMANTDILRAAEQLGSLGLSPNNVLSTGGSFTPQVQAANSSMANNAGARFEQASHIASSLIGMASRMASAGIYGTSLSQVKNSAAKVASAAAHSATEVRHYDANGNRTGSSFTYNVRGSNADDVSMYFGF